MSTQAHDVEREVKQYIVVFVALMVLTVVTVAISYLHLSIVKAIIVALLVATIKGSLVACYFMHLISERKLIYWVLMLTVVFFLGLLLLPMSGFRNPIYGTKRYSDVKTTQTSTPIVEEHVGGH